MDQEFKNIYDTNTEILSDYILDGQPFADTGVVLLTDLDMLTMVAGMPGAIGYASWSGKKYYEFILSNQYPAARLFSLPRMGDSSSIEIGFRGESEVIAGAFSELVETIREMGLPFENIQSVAGRSVAG